MARVRYIAAHCIILVFWAANSQAQEGGSQNDANNPLTPKITINFHDYYVPELIDLPGASTSKAGDYYVPVGFGIGKVIPVSDKVTMNAFVEPPYTVFNEGAGNPRWQIFAGANFKFSLAK